MGGRHREDEEEAEFPSGQPQGRRGMEEGGEIEDAESRASIGSMDAEDMKLERLVEFPTWREMLLDLVAAKKLDPWNIDIAEIASSYLERIRKMEKLDLRIPANLILAAAILIRFKSEALRFEEEAQEAVEETYVEEDAAPEVIPVLELRTRIPPKRMVTLDELLVAMEKVFEEQRKREEKAHRVEIPSVINIQLPEFNIEQRMAEVYGMVVRQKDAEGLATFSSLLKERTPVEVIRVLLPVLHLAQDRKITIFQEQFFGEIFIRVREESKEEAGASGKGAGMKAG